MTISYVGVPSFAFVSHAGNVQICGSLGEEPFCTYEPVMGKQKDVVLSSQFGKGILETKGGMALSHAPLLRKAISRGN